MHLYCSTPQAILLFGVSVRGVLLFASDSTEAPGLHLPVVPRSPINDQLGELITSRLGAAIRRCGEVDQQFCQVLGEGPQASSLYVGSARGGEGFDPPLAWQTMPALLTRMPRNRTRLPYLQAWQVLTGAYTLSTRAVVDADASWIQPS